MIKQIKITYGSGEGSTKLSAFDKALWDAGIANYNLIKLSSVIPKNTKVVVKKLDWNNKDIGNKLYVVLSECITDKIGKEAWASLAWVQAKDGSGILIEHNGNNKEKVIELIKDSLKQVVEYRPKKYGPPKWKIEGIKCKGRPVCAVVCAVFQSEAWK
jgi:arginine decarboxylase